MACPIRTDSIVDHTEVVWVDENIHEYIQTQQKFRQNIKTLYTFNDAEKCVQYIVANPTKKVFLIIRGSLATQILQREEDLKSIINVYIFCLNKNRYKNELENNYQKVKSGGIFDHDEDLLLKIMEDMVNFFEQEEPNGKGGEEAQKLKELHDKLYKTKCTLMWKQAPFEEDRPSESASDLT
ncbi:unnamed protein product [Didymodactylos carnosus]|uniref:Uncharacterized protein n=1 Tax=Didymodactylos carnosus TaxID=1234261 RepID=A0A8S2SPF8_9BILA|nr:unnamed protein product [Didymodactylos carnosus]CAF4233743.1 unnamed protein product [Didymodactylos carnosus]